MKNFSKNAINSKEHWLLLIYLFSSVYNSYGRKHLFAGSFLKSSASAEEHHQTLGKCSPKGCEKLACYCT